MWLSCATTSPTQLMEWGRYDTNTVHTSRQHNSYPIYWNYGKQTHTDGKTDSESLLTTRCHTHTCHMWCQQGQRCVVDLGVWDGCTHAAPHTTAHLGTADTPAHTHIQRRYNSQIHSQCWISLHFCFNEVKIQHLNNAFLDIIISIRAILLFWS